MKLNRKDMAKIRKSIAKAQKEQRLGLSEVHEALEQSRVKFMKI